MKGKLIPLLFSLLITIILTACNSPVDPANAGTFPIDVTFSDFYKELGGELTLGPAISPAFEKQGISYQYVVAGLMTYDPNQIPLTRFYFSRVAVIEWGINDLVEPSPLDPNHAYVNGYRIWDEVLAFYHRYGPEIIGLPITGVKANEREQRYEQFFEGIGFYRDYRDPAGKIKLMPYGAWMCGKNCQSMGNNSNQPSSSYVRDYSETEQLFLKEAERHGYEFTGSPLSSPYLADDGNFEMIFENIAMFIDPSDGYRIKLRPLPAWLGIHTDPPTREVKEDWLSFYSQGNGIGYNIPREFSTYISNHGGMEFTGVPITEYQILPDDGYTQCFTHLCLKYQTNAPESLRIRPYALGADYQTNGESSVATESTMAGAIQLNVWEQYPLIPSGQRQVISIEAKQNDTPTRNIELSLIVKQPDGIVKTYSLSPTGEEGTTSIELDPINGPNGAIIQYEVCIVDLITPQVCFTRSYTIWKQ